ncbi:S1 family peptidase [Nakamurella lactea]|uniref:S1 family peptidase n=1 Tax=Nakamurella lactea TaxID=459515 RepID=UPI000A06BC86|nr:S1 family peptidase [Nakamurella lactea]
MNLKSAAVLAPFLALYLTPGVASSPIDQTGGPAALVDLGDESLEAAALQLAIDEVIPVDEAARQMANQERLIDQNMAAMAVLGDTYAGSYIDHSSGTLVVKGTSMESLNRVLLELGTPPDLKVQQAAQSKSYMENALWPELRRELESAGISASSAVFQVASNRLEVRIPTDSAPVPPSFLATNPEVSILRVDPEPATCNSDLGHLACTSPMRGGVYIKGASHTACSAGFMVKSMTDSSHYILTAGHCATGGDVENFTGLRVSDLQQVSIGKAHSSQYDPSHGSDSAIVHVTNTASWGSGTNNTVYVLASSEVIDDVRYVTTRNENYAITAARYSSTLPVNSYLCRTGTSSGTKCGPFRGTEAGKTYLDFYARVCSGDSGGPVYIAHTAHGIVSQMVGAVNGCTSAATGYTVAEEVRTALIERNVWLNGVTP